MKDVINSVAKHEARKVREELTKNIEQMSRQNDEQK